MKNAAKNATASGHAASRGVNNRNPTTVVDGTRYPLFLRGRDIPAVASAIEDAPPQPFDPLAEAYQALEAFKASDPSGYQASRRMWQKLARHNQRRAMVARLKKWLGAA